MHTRLGVASCFCYLFLFWNASLSPVLGLVAPVDWASPFKWLWQFQQQQPTSSGRKKALNHKNWGWRGGWELDWGKAACGRTSWEGCMCCPDSSLSDFTSSQWCSLLAIENHLFKKAVYNKPTPHRQRGTRCCQRRLAELIGFWTVLYIFEGCEFHLLLSQLPAHMLKFQVSASKFLTRPLNAYSWNRKNK